MSSKEKKNNQTNSGDTDGDAILDSVLDLTIELAAMSKYGAPFAMVAGPLKEILMPGEQEPDFKALLDKLGNDIQDSVENAHRHTRDEIIKQAQLQEAIMESNFNDMETKMKTNTEILKRYKGNILFGLSLY